MASAMDERVMSAVASGIASRYGVKVTVSGTGAYSTRTLTVKNGRTVFVPEINIPAEVRKPSPDAMTLMRGYLDHEAAHVRWSDWEQVSLAAADPFLKSMLNIIEDVRIERLMGGTFAGSKQNLTDIAELLFGGDEWKRQIAALASDGGSDRAAAMMALSWTLYRMRSIDVPSLRHGLDALSGVFDAVRPKTRAALERTLRSWLKSNGWPADTKAALDLANALAKKFRSTGCDGADSGGDGGDEGGDEGGGTKERAAERAAEAMDEHGVAGAEADALAELAAQAAGQRASVSASSTNASAEEIKRLTSSTPGLGSLGNAVNGRLDAMDGGQNAARDAAAHSLSAFWPHSTALHNQILRRWRPADMANARNLCAGLGAKLSSLLQTQTRTMQGTGRSGRRLASSVLWRAGARDGRVFRTVARRMDSDASVLILVDSSGSMQGECEDLASAAVLSTLNALDQVKGVQSGACVFSAADEERLIHSVIRLPGDRTPAASLPRPGANGCTDIAGSMMHCASLIPQDSPRRIMLVVSDGEDDPRTIRDAERRLAGRGILVAGVGIGSSHLERSLTRVRIANKASDIPSAVFGALQDVLLHGCGR